MWIKQLHLINIKSFTDTGKINLSKKINILIGQNNSGKTTVLQAIYRLQNQSILSHDSIRTNQDYGVVNYVLNGICESDAPTIREGVIPEYPHYDLACEYSIRRQQAPQLMIYKPQTNFNSAALPNSEPYNAIYPFLSRRKVSTLEHTINAERVSQVRSDLAFINAKLDQLRESLHPKHEVFSSYVDRLLGLKIGSFFTQDGKQSGLFIDQYNYIPLESMGEGVTQLLGLAGWLSYASNKIFIIEEPENDIHPAALKELLHLISISSNNNQFVISTHSNIVLKYLGSEPDAKVFEISINNNMQVPESDIREVPNNRLDRARVLESLGYEFSDNELWEAWLLLEESTAERVVRELLIPWFTPNLVGKIRTISAGGATKVEAKFDDLHRLFLFIHLEPIYKDKAWVIVDGDKAGTVVKNKLADRFRGSWNEEHFKCLQRDNFEYYYPSQFQDDAEAALKLTSLEMLQAKGKLAERVVAWAIENETEARTHFEEKASDLIQILKDIEAQVTGKS